MFLCILTCIFLHSMAEKMAPLDGDASPVYQDPGFSMPRSYDGLEPSGKAAEFGNDEAAPLEMKMVREDAAVALAVEPFAEGWLNEVGSAFNFQCKKGEAISGFRTQYAHRLLHHDRLWSFECAATSLLSGSEEVYREGYASTNHGEIDFNCKKGVLVGISSAKPGKRYYRTFTFHCMYVKLPNIISYHHVREITSDMVMIGKSDSSLVATRPSAVAAVTGIKAVVAKSKTEWTIKTSELIGVTCQPGFKGVDCSESCTSFPCSLTETMSPPGGKSFSFYCPPNQVIRKLVTQVDSSGNTRWGAQCRYSQMLSQKVNGTYVAKRLMNLESWVCPEGSVMTGIEHVSKSDFPVEYFILACTTGIPRNAQKCQSRPNVQGQVLNPSGGGFSLDVEKKYIGISGLDFTSDGEGRKIWTPSFADMSCNCKDFDTSTKWNFYEFELNGLTGYVLGSEWNGTEMAGRVTLSSKNGNDGQLWMQRDGHLVNRLGFVLDHRGDGKIFLAKETGYDSQKWSWKEGRILNEKTKEYLSTFGMPWEGMPLFTTRAPTSIDKNWAIKEYVEEYACQDSCWKDPCQNKGVCVKNPVTGYECNCAPGFIGRDCKEDIDECLPSLCKNGATCQDGRNDYSCRCTPEYHGKDCDIPNTNRAKLEDIRCVDIVPLFNPKIKFMKEKILICLSVSEAIDQRLKLTTILHNLIELGHKVESPLDVLKMIAASTKLRQRYENYPLKCIREGHIEDFPTLQQLMKTSKVKAITESVQEVIKMAVQFYQSPVEGPSGIVQLLKVKGEICGEGPCVKEDILGIIATNVLPAAPVYDGFKLDPYRKSHDFC